MIEWNPTFAYFFSTYLTLHVWPHYNLICLTCSKFLGFIRDELIDLQFCELAHSIVILSVTFYLYNIERW